MEEIEILKKYEKLLREEKVFTIHALYKIKIRGLNKKFIEEKIKDVNSIFDIEYNPEKKTYKVVYKLSRKYNLVVIFDSEFKKIVSVFKSSKPLEKLIKKRKWRYIHTKRYI